MDGMMYAPEFELLQQVRDINYAFALSHPSPLPTSVLCTLLPPIFFMNREQNIVHPINNQP